MVQRNFMNRGPTLNQLAEAERARRSRKAAATAQALVQPGNVNTVNTAIANTAASNQAQKSQAKPAVIGADARGRQIVATAPKNNSNSLQAAQRIQSQTQPAKPVSTAQPAQTAQKSGFVAPGRQSRQGPVSGGRWTVRGKTLSQSQAEEDMARASALQNASVNNNIIGGSGQVRGVDSSYYDVDSSLADIYKQAQAAGVSISRPKTYGKTVSDSGQAQAILNAYVKSANDAIAAKSKSSGVSSGSGAYFDVDSSLNSIYNQAKSAGVTISKPKSYGKTVTSEKQAQGIIDSYVKAANDAISAKSKSSAASSGGSGEYYDVDASLNSIYNQARSAGVNVSKPKAYGKSVTTSAAAKAAYDEYYNYVDREYNTFNANNTTNSRKQAIKNSIDDADRALTHSDREEMAKWNRENKNMYDTNKTINPAYMYWLKHGSSGTAAPPKYYEDAINEDYDKWASRDSANAARESQVAASQAKLQSTYDAVQKESGTTHAKNSKVVIAGQKAVAKAPSTVTSSPTNKKLTIISAADSKKVQVAQTAARKAEVKSANESASKAKSVASDAKNESSAYNKAILQKQAEIKKTANQSVKSALKSELKSLQKEANDSKKRADTADAAAKAAVNYSKAASALAVAPIASKSEAVAIKKLNVAATKVDSTNAAASKAGVQDHAGQILLKDGTWINQKQVIGARSKGEKAVKVFGTTQEYQKQLSADYKSKLAGKSTPYRENPEYQVALDSKVAEIKELQAVRDAYRPIVGKTGNVYDAVQMIGSRGVGEDRVTVYRETPAGKIVARSGTASEYVNAMKQAKKIGAIPITSGTSKSDTQLILDARKYYNDRVEVPVNFSPQSRTVSVVETKLSKIAETLDKLSKPGTSGKRHAAALKKAATNDVSLKEDLVLAAKPYLEGGKTLMANVEAGVSLENLARAPAGITRGVSTQIAGKYGKSSVTRGLNKAADFVQYKGPAAVDNTVVTLLEANVDYSPLSALNKYAKSKYGESGWTRAADLTTGVAKKLPISVYEDIRKRPVGTAANAALIYAGGAALGAATKFGTLGGRVALKSAGGVARSAASKAEAKLLGTAIAKNTRVMSLASRGLYLPSDIAKLGVNHGEKAVNSYLGYELLKSASDTVKTGDAEKVSDAIKTFAVGGIGFGRGMKAGAKVYDRVRLIGGKEIPLESIVTDAEVLSGASQFPTTKGASRPEFVKMFKGENGKNVGYHASTDRLSNTVEVGSKISRPTDMPGLYVAPVKTGASPYFLRTEKSRGGVREFASAVESAQKALGKVKKSGKALDITSAKSRAKFTKNVKQATGKVITAALGESTPLSPTVHRIEFGKVRSLPNSRSVKGSQEFLVTKNAQKGSAYLTPRLERGVAARAQGTEAEAVITPGTRLQRVTSGKRYFKYNDRLVALDDYKVMEAKGLIKKGEMGKREVSKTELKDAYSRDPASFKRGYLPTGRAYTYTPSGARSDVIASRARDVSRDYGTLNRLSNIYSRTAPAKGRDVVARTSTRASTRGGARSLTRAREAERTPTRRTGVTRSDSRYIPTQVRYTPTGERYTAKPDLHRAPPTRQGPYHTGYVSGRTGESRAVDVQRSKKYTPTRTPGPDRYALKPLGYGSGYPGRTPSFGGYGGNGGSRGGKGGTSGGNHAHQKILVFVDESPLIQKKKKAKDEISTKRVKADVRLTRDIRNRLGSLESMFGTSQKSQAKRKTSSVTSTKAKPVTKTAKPRASVKRAERA